MTDAVGPGRRVAIEFSLRLADGRLVEQAEAAQPLEFVYGDGSLAAGLEQRLLGLRAGDRRSFRIDADEGVIGDYDESRVQSLPRREFTDPPRVDEVIGFTLPTGEEVPGVVMAVDAQQVTVDFNHPLVGRDFEFRVRLLSVSPARRD